MMQNFTLTKTHTFESLSCLRNSSWDLYLVTWQLNPLNAIKGNAVKGIIKF